MLVEDGNLPWHTEREHRCCDACSGVPPMWPRAQHNLRNLSEQMGLNNKRISRRPRGLRAGEALTYNHIAYDVRARDSDRGWVGDKASRPVVGDVKWPRQTQPQAHVVGSPSRAAWS